ncbi:MAG: KTSC domain-containing protein [Kiritimatiellia bacterium]
MKTIALALASLLLLSVAAVAADVEMVAVESSLLHKVGYDPEAKTLVVQMNNSSDRYVYSNVSQTVFDNLLAAPSKGSFYVKKIKGKYPVERK